MAKTTILVDAKPTGAPVLVSVFLGGGADGLHLAPPINDGYYRKNRATLAVSKEKALPLNDIFSFNPEMAEAHKLYEKGDLAVIHQCGTEEDSRSHFEATDFLHYGGRSGGGWLGRFLHHSKNPNPGGGAALSAVSIGEKVSDELQGVAAVALRSLQDFKLPNTKAPIPAALAKLYGKTTPGLSAAAGDTLEAIAKIRKIAEEHAEKQQKQKGPQRDSFAEGMELIALLIQMNLGLRAATIELGGWDSHFGQAQFLGGKIPTLSKGLAAFATAMGGNLGQAHVVVTTEFGRTVSENTSFGTDHGRASIAMVMGGGVKGGKIHHAWEGLNDKTVENPEGILGQIDKRGDLAVKIDYRQILLPVMRQIDPHVKAEKLFPGFTGQLLPLYG
jgi:uncharacterized protein (DUF1501 family)